MTGEKTISLAVSLVCLLALLIWLYYWLEVASRDSGLGPTVTMVNNPDGSQSFPVTYSYDSAQRYGPYIPLVVIGMFGSFVGSIVGAIVFAWITQKAHGRSFVAIPLSGGLGPLSAVSLVAAFGGAWVTFSVVINVTSLQRSLGILILLPGVCIFCGIPALLASVGTSSLLYGLPGNLRRQPTFLPSGDPTRQAE